MGAVRLDAVTPHMIQSFYNSKIETHSAKTIKNFHGILHAALKQAVLNGYIHTNPTDASIRPRIEKKEMHPMDEYLITDFLEAIRGNQLPDGESCYMIETLISFDGQLTMKLLE